MRDEQADRERALQLLETKFSKSYPKVILILSRRLGVEMPVAEDAMQEVFVRLLVYLAEGRSRDFVAFEGEAHFVNYLLKAGANQCRARSKHLSREEQNEWALLTALAETSDPEIQLVVRQEHQLLEESLQEIGDPYRKIFECLLQQGMTLAEAAREHQIKPGSIYTQFQRGLEKLRQKIKDKSLPRLKGAQQV
jgi:RNA polymerase sigma factor (sigma-70 family)